MNFLPGTSMRSMQQTGKRVGAPQLRKMLTSALTALAALHSRGIAHRDIKPDNLQVFNDDVIILDLGLACFSKEWGNRGPVMCDTGSPNPTGTRGYMSPERLTQSGDPVTFSSDVFSLAQSFYPFITGREHDMFGVTKSSMELYAGDPVLSQVLYQMLARDKEKRPTAAGALRLLRLLPPPPQLQQAQKQQSQQQQQQQWKAAQPQLRPQTPFQQQQLASMQSLPPQRPVPPVPNYPQRSSAGR